MVEISIRYIGFAVILVASILIIALLLGAVNTQAILPFKGNSTHQTECLIWNGKGCEDNGKPYIPSKLQEEVEECSSFNSCVEYCRSIGVDMSNCLWY